MPRNPEICDSFNLLLDPFHYSTSPFQSFAVLASDDPGNSGYRLLLWCLIGTLDARNLRAAT